MNNFAVMLVLVLILGLAFTASTYFVTSYETIDFTCMKSSSNNSHAQDDNNNTYKKNSHGFPFFFYYKFFAPDSPGCQQSQNQLGSGVKSDSQGNIIAHTDFSKQNFLKDYAIWGTALFLIAIFLFGVRKQPK
jgi:hypothetical protein